MVQLSGKHAPAAETPHDDNRCSIHVQRLLFTNAMLSPSPTTRVRYVLDALKARGGGAFSDGVPLAVNRPESLGQSLLSTGFSYSQTIRTQQAQVMARVMPHIRDIRRMGAASLDLTAIAAGQLDIYFERMLQPWDHAAGVLIAREAGAEIRGWNGAAPDIDWLLAAHPEVVDEIESILVESGAHFDIS